MIKTEETLIDFLSNILVAVGSLSLEVLNNNDDNNYLTILFPYGIRKQKINIIFKWNITWLRIPTGRRQTSWLFLPV